MSRRHRNARTKAKPKSNSDRWCTMRRKTEERIRAIMREELATAPVYALKAPDATVIANNVIAAMHRYQRTHGKLAS